MSAARDEVAELRQRLAEAEETLRAIREGEVDALVVGGAEQPQVFRLDSGESFRAFMEAMDLGAAALDAERRPIYANAALETLLGCPADTLQREGLLAVLGPAAAKVQMLLDSATSGKMTAQVGLVVGGRARHVVVTAAPLHLAFAEGFALTFTDITDRVEAAAAEESERIGRAVMASANEAVLVCDEAGRITHASPAVSRIQEASPVGRAFEEAFPLVFAPGAAAMGAEDLVAIAAGGSSVRGIEASLQVGGRALELVINAAPLHGPGGRVHGCILTLVDLTERKALEKRQTLLMGELDHRMKNMLALVLAISSRTLAAAKDLADFRARFTQRISALSATQNLLAEKSWTGLTVEELICAELAPYVAPRGPRVTLAGLAEQVTRDAAVSLGLVLHELTTNAVKYGALSNDAGRVTVTGTRQPDGSFALTWQEEGGPPVAPPRHHGFGQSVIARGLGQASGSAKVEFRPDGVLCRITLASSGLA
ncbi:HWE histidine kinase domain-containing protein [Paracraurococcus lichenis]|uniref:histidine kinase n=1 Tax=Paracraurococcus lichenis TaxID=3064888 RepID=A0ABT9EBL2_9PROT|nr:HWE histidine kinase domain-containing protein [Paracraurococcus sp. LOR1-02]MDO9713608.1 HWE histidine kinase domain-containing protein [Paracraurococcus sp. LOR1-02]